MSIPVLVLAIPPPPDNDPDPPDVFHYTTGRKLALILRSGHLKPSTAHVPSHEKPVTWFSTSDQWEPTATKCTLPGKPGQLMTARLQGGLARIAVPSSIAPYGLSRLPALAGTSPEGFLGLVLAGIELGADPGSWRFTLGPVYVSLFRRVELFDFDADLWRAVDLAEVASRN